MQVEFTAPEYQPDGSIEPGAYRFEGSVDGGWSIHRGGQPHLEVGPGYRLLRTVQCGICATDLARRFLPFALPQITGHETLAIDDEGRRHVVEINASHAARGLDSDCAFCRAGLETHCPERIVLGIHDLPGGFGPYILAPVNAVIPVDDAIPSDSATLAEPFAAAMRAVRVVAPRPHDRIAVLGPRRLGMLVVAALAAHRRSSGTRFTIVALTRRARLLPLAENLGADESFEVVGDGSHLPSASADVVIDTTGSPRGLDLAIRLARREVHLKSTHGQPAAGLEHLTEMVVDELSIGEFPTGWAAFESEMTRLGVHVAPTVAWLATGAPPAWLNARASVQQGDAPDLLERLEQSPAPSGLPRADAVVVDSASGLAAAARPRADRQVSLVRPRGLLFFTGDNDGESTLLAAIRDRGLRLTTSRCGDLREAVAAMEKDADLRTLGKKLISHTFDATRLDEALATAASPDCIKAVARQ